MFPQFKEKNFHTKILNSLSQQAFLNKSAARARITSAIVLKGTVISFGSNSYKSHTFQSKFASNSHSIYLHAETTAIKNALKVISVEDMKNSTLYICRIKFTSSKKDSMQFGLACPCIGCARAILTYNLASTIYTTDDDNYVRC